MEIGIKSTGNDYGQALAAVQAGHRIARIGWNGKDMFVFLCAGDSIYPDIFQYIKSLPQSVKDYFTAKGQGAAAIEFTPYLCLKAVDDTIVNGWIASQADTLATDWVILS